MFWLLQFKIENFGLSPEGCSFVSIILEKYVMRAGPQLGVAKAARAPPCTLPILGRRFHSLNVNLFTQKEHLSRLILDTY